MILRFLTFSSMTGTVLLAFLWAPRAEVLGDTSRILYFHVPMAWVSVLAFMVAGYFSIRYLMQRKKPDMMLDNRAHNAAELGTLFTLLTTVSGSIWAKLMWGTYWNWDPRETSILFLLLIYIAYLSLRLMLPNRISRASISASYLILAALTVPFFIFIIPRIFPSLHPDTIINSEHRIKMDNSIRLVLLSGVISFTFLFALLYRLKNRAALIAIKLEEYYEHP